jgi:excisionase family DNA binding protein
MDVREAAKKIGLSPSKLYQLLAARQIAHYRVGGKIILTDADIAAFLTGCHVSATPADHIPQPPRLKLKHISLGRGA